MDIQRAHAMAPSSKKLERALVDGTSDVFCAEPDATTVNKVRQHVELKLRLDKGFFTTVDWKQRSKAIIKESVVSCRAGRTVLDTAQACRWHD